MRSILLTITALSMLSFVHADFLDGDLFPLAAKDLRGKIEQNVRSSVQDTYKAYQNEFNRAVKLEEEAIVDGPASYSLTIQVRPKYAKLLADLIIYSIEYSGEVIDLSQKPLYWEVARKATEECIHDFCGPHGVYEVLAHIDQAVQLRLRYSLPKK